jgi:hypothetical protein
LSPRRLLLLDCGGIRGGYSEAVLTTLARIAQDYKVNSVVIEPNFGGGMFNELLKPMLQKVGYPVEVVDAEHSSAQKEGRIIDSLEPVLNQHKLVVNTALILKNYKSTKNLPAEEVNRYGLFYQLTRITKDKGVLVNDDRIDVVALGVHDWTGQMARDQYRGELKYLEEQDFKGDQRCLPRGVPRRVRA